MLSGQQRRDLDKTFAENVREHKCHEPFPLRLPSRPISSVFLIKVKRSW